MSTTEIKSKSADKVHFIRLNRDVKGERIPWLIVFNSNRDILDEGPENEVRKRRGIQGGLPIRGSNMLPNQEDIRKMQLEALKRRGVKFERKGNKLELTHIPEIEVEIGRFFIKEMECRELFPGMDKLREQYFLDRKKHEDGTGKCKGCAVVKLKKKYRDIIDGRLNAFKKAAQSAGD